MKKKSIMIDMDEVIVVGNFSNYLIEFLGKVDFDKLNSQYRQDLIKGRKKEFRNKKLTNEELENKGIVRVNNWLDVKKELL